MNWLFSRIEVLHLIISTCRVDNSLSKLKDERSADFASVTTGT
jgi:hypothetical protein